jgi:hypothetical protein
VEERLPMQNWHWPQETWFQKRRNYLRTRERQALETLDRV